MSCLSALPAPLLDQNIIYRLPLSITPSVIRANCLKNVQCQLNGVFSWGIEYVASSSCPYARLKST